MEQKSRQHKSNKDLREARLKEALKANLMRRKAQAKARDGGGTAQGRDAHKDKG